MQILPGAESFLLRGTNKKAILLLHGYTGTPSEMLPLGNYLHSLGYTVSCVRLPGHGTNVTDLEQTTAADWYNVARKECEQLLKNYPCVYIAGLSMGGLLAIKLAAYLPVKKAVFIAAPIFVQDKRTPFLPLLRFFIRYLPKHKRNYYAMQQYCISYDKMPTRPLVSLFVLLRECKKLLKGINIPCLVLQSEMDHTVKPCSAQYIYDKLGSYKKYLVWYKNSGHILTLDSEHLKVFAEISRFFEE